MSKWTPSKTGLVVTAVIAVLGLVALALMLTVQRLPEACCNAYQATQGDQTVPAATPVEGERPADVHSDERPKENHESNWWGIPADGWVAIFTLALVAATVSLFCATMIAIRDARKATERDQRAYVGINDLRFVVHSDEASYDPAKPMVAGEMRKDFIVLSLQNFGKTPAFEVAARVALMALPLGGGIDPRSNLDVIVQTTAANLALGQTRALLQAGQKTDQSAGLGDARQYWTASRREVSLFVLGRVYYRDAFGKHWSTKFCYQWEPESVLGQRFVPWSIYNDEDNAENPDT